ncbi:MAG TPA: flagellar basal body rod protein FlgB [Steroidobacteraceae bacterium]|nr:flagellar basal body rod protein FlgB [Steroidobacteraceae bacterium]
MPLNLDAYLGVDPLALKLQGQRMEVLAKNLANVDTPNYKAQDIDFQSALAAAAAASPALGAAGGAGSTGAPLTLSTTQPDHLGGASSTDPNPQLLYRVPLAPSLDGNTVDAQLEQAAFAENTVRYQATLTFLSSKMRELMTAITGQ